MTKRTFPVLGLALKSARSLAKLPLTVLLKQFGLAASLLLGSEKSSCPLVSVEGHERKGEGNHFLFHLTLGFEVLEAENCQDLPSATLAFK